MGDELSGRNALVTGQDGLVLVSALAKALENVGAHVRLGDATQAGSETDLLVAIYVLEPVGSLEQFSVQRYEQLANASIKQLYADLYVAVPQMTGAGDKSVVVVICQGSAGDDPLAQGLSDGMEAVVGAFAARFAPDSGIRVNALRTGPLETPEAISALTVAVAMLTGSSGSYVNGMTTPMLNGVPRVRV